MSVSFASMLSQVRDKRPLIHVISNYVTLNDVVNIILAAGGTAIAADDPAEAEEITGIAQGLYLNSGMPSDRKLKAMILAGKAANQRGIPVVLDPVGAGASAFRQQFLTTLLLEVRMTCIRGNAAEIAALSGMTFASRGVESTSVAEPVRRIQQLSERLNCIIAVSGEEDMVVTPQNILTSHTGSPMAKRITGSGCMLSGLLAVFLAAGIDGTKRETAAENFDAEKLRTGNILSSIRTQRQGESPKGTQTDTGKWPTAESYTSQTQLVQEVMKQYGLAQEHAQKIVRAQQGGTMTFREELINAVDRWGQE